MEVSKVVGIKKVVNKETNKESFTYCFQIPFTQYEIENCSCEGICVTAEYSAVDLGLKVGDTGIPVYSKGFQGKAVLTGFIPAK